MVWISSTIRGAWDFLMIWGPLGLVKLSIKLFLALACGPGVAALSSRDKFPDVFRYAGLTASIDLSPAAFGPGVRAY